jgi:2-keto-4-pentenoate hydratase/2-oxohepta-3-ene-1,7-dioic acid hydratase in catechol pathway
MEDIRLLAPLPRPRRLRDCLAFEKHVRQVRANRYLYGWGKQRTDPSKVEIPEAWYREPVYYKGNHFSVVGTDAAVNWPTYSRLIDYELEVGLVSWDRVADLAESEALKHVFGYLIFNDFSARDTQHIEMQAGLGPAKGKDFDGGNAFGPWLVTADEVADPQALTMIARVNGEERSHGSTSEMQHTFASIVSHASRGETLQPGEIIGSGTVGGGSGAESARFLKHGDVVELEVSGLGVLRNTISAPHVPVPPQLPVNILSDGPSISASPPTSRSGG